MKKVQKFLSLVLLTLVAIGSMSPVVAQSGKKSVKESADCEINRRHNNCCCNNIASRPTSAAVTGATLNIAGAANVGGALTVTGFSNLNGGAQITGNETVTGNAIINGNANIGGALAVAGLLSLTSPNILDAGFFTSTDQVAPILANFVAQNNDAAAYLAIAGGVQVLQTGRYFVQYSGTFQGDAAAITLGLSTNGAFANVAGSIYSSLTPATSTLAINGFAIVNLNANQTLQLVSPSADVLTATAGGNQTAELFIVRLD